MTKRVFCILLAALMLGCAALAAWAGDERVIIKMMIGGMPRLEVGHGAELVAEAGIYNPGETGLSTAGLAEGPTLSGPDGEVKLKPVQYEAAPAPGKVTRLAWLIPHELTPGEYLLAWPDAADHLRSADSGAQVVKVIPARLVILERTANADELAHGRRSRLRATGKWPELIAILDEEIKKRPEAYGPRKEKVGALAGMGRYGEAADELAEMLAMMGRGEDPHIPSSYLAWHRLLSDLSKGE